MKLLTKEEEDAHYSQVLKGGTIGTVLGLVGGYAGVLAASRRFHTVRDLTIPMKAFLVTSSGTFVGIIGADRSSRSFEAARNQSRQWYENREEQMRAQELQGMTFADRAMAWARRERYTIVGTTWLASMVGSFALVGRNPYLSGQQKLVQARVYAQGLTLAVLIASAAFEISEQRRVRRELEKKSEGAAAGATAAGAAAQSKVQESKGEEGDLWKEMVAAEEERLKKKHLPVYEQHQQAVAKAESKTEGSSGSPVQKAEAESVPSEQKQEQKDEEKKQN
ncbi:HIG1 domain-containing protein [Aspergillus undulatus]|uniref:HIG1 domain-containing protein n=1 Tax=Aspergillus undulatus TaxID=1810928 RepID=UPI003CCD05DB